MKRLTATLLAAAMCMGTFAGCGSNTEETTDNSNAGAAAGETAAATTESQTASAENVHLDALNVYFVPSRDPEEIVTATEPLSDLLKNELAGLGDDVDSVNITVGKTPISFIDSFIKSNTTTASIIPPDRPIKKSKYRSTFLLNKADIIPPRPVPITPASNPIIVILSIIFSLLVLYITLYTSHGDNITKVII